MSIATPSWKNKIVIVAKYLFTVIAFMVVVEVIHLVVIDNHKWYMLDIIRTIVPVGQNFTVAWMYLMPVVAVCIVAFTSGLTFYINPRIAFFATVGYLIFSWLFQIEVGFIRPDFSLQFLAAICIHNSLLLATVPFVSK